MDLDEVIEFKLEVKNFCDFDKVVDFCELVIKKGFDEDGLIFVNDFWVYMLFEYV